MNRAFFALPGSVGVIVLALARPAIAQNLLTNNAGFEANTGYYTPGWGWPDGSPDALPGWVITLDPSGDGYAGAAANQSPQDLEGTHFGYIYSGTGSAGFLETAPEFRAPVEAGTTYTCWFLARGDSPSGEALATASLIWYVNQNNGSTSGDPATLDLILPIRLSTEDPMSTFHITAVAPNGAHYAGVRLSRPENNYDPIIVDDFVIMAEPTQVSLSIMKNTTHAMLAWPRGLGQHLEENSNPAITTDWHKVSKPVKGVGATNYADYPLTEDVRFFRLSGPNDSKKLGNSVTAPGS
jgi:hypothetical protein